MHSLQNFGIIGLEKLNYGNKCFFVEAHKFVIRYFSIAIEINQTKCHCKN